MSDDGLVISGVTKRFDPSGSPALVQVDLEVRPGRCLVLLGESGSGKTTLLRILAGLETPDTGTVTLDERVLNDPHIVVPPEDRGIGMVFQSLELWPHMTAAEHFAFGLPGRPRGRRALTDERVLSLAFAVGLDAAHLARRPDALSGGERQRVAIARTLAAEPSVVLYDEPLASLDPSRRAVMRLLIRRLSAERGTTTVHVTHDPEEALAMADEIAVLARGRVVERGSPEALFCRPRTLKGARALGPVSALPARIDGDDVVTALGRTTLKDAEQGQAGASSAAILALWRPAQIEVGTGGAPATVAACRAAGSHYVVTCDVDGHTVYAHAVDSAVVGSRVGLTVKAPAVVVPAPIPSQEEAA